jgi:type III pantothenate kinase
MISPGMGIRFKAMNQFTAGLPLVKMDDSKKFPGKSTVESIQIGVSQSIRHEIMGYVQEQNELYDSLKIVFCGENILHFDKVIKNEIFARPNLVLEGLNYIIQHHA